MLEKLSETLDMYILDSETSFFFLFKMTQIIKNSLKVIAYFVHQFVLIARLLTCVLMQYSIQ